MFLETSTGISFEAKIVPNSSKNEIVGFENEKLKIRIQKAPEKNKANKELIAFLAKVFKIAKSRIKIVKGEKSVIKKIEIEGLFKKDALELLNQTK